MTTFDYNGLEVPLPEGAPMKMPPKTAPSKTRDRERSTQRFLQAGLEVFAEAGYDGATTKAIAQRAGLNEALLHRYFTNKNGLLLAVMGSATEAFQNEKVYPPAATPQEEIYLFLAHRLENDSVNENFMKVVIGRSLVDPEFCRQAGAFKPKPMDEFIGKRLLAFQQKGLLRPGVDLAVLVESLVAVCFGVGVMERLLFGRSVESCRQFFQAHSRNISQGICA